MQVPSLQQVKKTFLLRQVCILFATVSVGLFLFVGFIWLFFIDLAFILPLLGTIFSNIFYGQCI